MLKTKLVLSGNERQSGPKCGKKQLLRAFEPKIVTHQAINVAPTGKRCFLEGTNSKSYLK
jgi:hypothetical protein